MFSFFTKRDREMDAFQLRRKQTEVWKLVRRIIDVSAPNMPPTAGENRSQTRYNRAIPMLLVPWENGELLVGESVYTLSKDYSDNGVCLLPHRPFMALNVVCGFWIDGPVFLMGEVRSRAPIGGGFWQLGVQLTQVIPPGDVEALIPLAEDLAPPADFDSRTND